MYPPLIHPSTNCGFSSKFLTTESEIVSSPNFAVGRTAVIVQIFLCFWWWDNNKFRSTEEIPSPYVKKKFLHQ